MHRLWKDALVAWLNPPKRGAWKVLDVAGGTGDIAFRIVEASGRNAHATVLDINGSMLAVGRERAAKLGLEANTDFVEANAEELPFADDSFDAYTIAFGIRNVPRIETALAEAYRVLKPGGRFLCLEFSEVDMPLLDRAYEAWSFNAIPRIGQIVAGDGEPYAYLVESIRKFPNQQNFAAMMSRGRLRPGHLAQLFRRHRGAAFGLEALTEALRMSSLGAGFRLVRAGWIMVREGVVAALPGRPACRPAEVRLAHRAAASRGAGRCAASRSERLAGAVTRLGPSYVKLGQFLATRPDVVGTDIALDLALLQDRMETFPKAEAVAAIEGSLGRPIGELYESFGEPVAAASIAQVHPATVLRDGETVKVAVKVIRPGVRRLFLRDLESYFLAARLQERYIPSTRRLRPVEVTEALAQTTRIEMDMRLEAAALSELAENTRDDPGFRVPAVDWERTGRDVAHHGLDRRHQAVRRRGLRAAGHDLKAIAATLVQSFLRHTLRDGFFHADMHPGNLFVEADGTIVAVDLGISGRLGKKERRFLAEILYGFITRDYLRVAEVHFEAGYVPRKHDVAAFAQAIRAIGEPIHGQPAETISMARLLTLLFEVTELFDMQTRPELVLLQKTMVVVEGVARTLDPAFNMWKTAEPVVGHWIAGNLGPRGLLADARDGASALFSLARQAPGLRQAHRAAVARDRRHGRARAALRRGDGAAPSARPRPATPAPAASRCG